MLACDTLVILGSSFAYRNFYPDKARVIQIDLDPTQPPKIKLAQAKGFSLYMLKAVLSGRGSEVLELAKTNLR